MSIHIAIVGSHEFVETIRSLGSPEDVRFAYHPYEHPHEAATIAQTLGSFDGVFFSGSFPFAYAIPHLSHVAAHHVVQDETVLLTTLLYATLTHSVSLNQISIDLVDPERLTSILDSFPNERGIPTVMRISPDLAFEDVIAFHASHQVKQTSLAITSIERVHHELVRTGLNSQLMIEPTATVRHHLDQLIQQVRQQLADAAQFAIIRYDTDDISLRDHLASVRYLGGHLESAEDLLLTVLTTKGEVMNAFEEDTLAPNGTYRIGIGYGTDYQQADEHAQIALSAASKERIRIVDDSKRLSFPTRDAQIPYRVTEQLAFDFIKQAGVSPVNIGKILQFAKRKHEFTAKELTDYLDVTRRTAERLIKKLHDAGIVDVIGEEMSYGQGRPRAVYKFKFPTS
ncbi:MULTISPECIES: helix-turn-helix domain-containing protein [Exiguobacterium]|uniref:helix-turn-helix domain-containing protein n=1 Tax=Exiguobacterium TaxID=33986 RepID=UPI001BE8ADA0|nr:MULTISPECIES: HTH domain-containing protein [Exiguobacterium]MCT4775761.1 HTH domain-containing protein [Exiguobacterium aquaticum]MCT4790559.1 HTH domain-containing protein [Exiguobacterium mexicanum]